MKPTTVWFSSTSPSGLVKTLMLHLSSLVVIQEAFEVPSTVSFTVVMWRSVASYERTTVLEEPPVFILLVLLQP